MNDFDKIISSKLSEMNNFEPKEAVWVKIESSLTPVHTPIEKPLAAFIGGVAASTVIGLMLTQLPIMGPIHPAQHHLSDFTSFANDSELSQDVENEDFNNLENQTALFAPQELHEIDLTEKYDQDIAISKNSESNKPGKLKYTDPLSNSEKSQISEEGKLKNSVASNNSMAKFSALEEQLTFKASGIQCPDQKIQFNAIGDFDRYEWLFDGTELYFGKEVSITFKEPGIHQVLLLVYKGDLKYSKVKTIEIFDNPNPVVNSSIEHEPNCFKTKVKWSASPEATTFKWNFNGNESIGSESTHHLETGSHGIFLTAINEHGCVATSEHRVVVQENKQLFIPTAFSPDNNGKNDTWFPEGLDNCVRFSVKVFTLNSNSLVYETNELNPWNGILNQTASMAQKGEQYIYEVIAEDDCGQTIFKKGMIKVF